MSLLFYVFAFHAFLADVCVANVVVCIDDLLFAINVVCTNDFGRCCQFSFHLDVVYFARCCLFC